MKEGPLAGSKIEGCDWLNRGLLGDETLREIEKREWGGLKTKHIKMTHN